MLKKLLLFLFVFVVSLHPLLAQQSDQIFLQSRTIQLHQSPADLSDALNNGKLSPPLFAGKLTLIAHFNDIPPKEIKTAMTNQGVGLHGYVPNNNWWITIPSDFNIAQLEQWGVDYLYLPQYKDKLSPKLLTGQWPSHTEENEHLSLLAHTLEQTDPAKVQQDLARHSIGTPRQKGNVKGVYQITIQPDKLEQVAKLPYVYFLAPIDPSPQLERRTYVTDVRSNWLSENPKLPTTYNGNGVTLGVKEGKVNDNDIDLKGRLDNSNHTGGYSNHATGVANIMAGAGNYDPWHTGMAYGSDILSMSYAEPFIDFYNLGAKAVNNSYGWGCGFRVYGSAAANNDYLVRTNEDFMIIYSAGNEGNNDCGYGAGSPWGTISGSPKMAKNVIAVGATNIYDELMGFSSVGPATDGRIKPDVVAVGPGGTSHSCPGVVGIYGQLIEYYKSENNGDLPNTSLLKAVLQNTADDLGNSGPDFKFGYGRINVRRAYKLLENGNWWRDTVDHGQTNSDTLQVPIGTKQLRVMVYWADQEATPGASKILVNNLDFKVTDPNNNQLLPWVLDHTPDPFLLDQPAQRKVDTLNNMEQVTIDDPQAGNFTLTIDGSNVPTGPQDYFVVYEFVEEELQVTYPIGGEALVPFESEVIRWDSYGGNGTFDLSYSTDSGATWSTIATGVPNDQNYYDWVVPDEVTGRAMIKVERDTMVSASDTFSIIPVPKNLDVLWACGDSLMLYWDSLPEAQEYEVSRLGNKYMDSIGRTSNLYFKVRKINLNAEQWFSIRALGLEGASGERAIAIKENPGPSNCILQDAAVFDILSPLKGEYPDCIYGGKQQVKVRVMNMGVNPINDVPVSYQLNGGSIVTDTLFDTIPSAARRNIAFGDSVSLTAGTNTLKVWTGLSSDGKASNDTMTIEIEVYNSSIVNFQYKQDFENFDLCSTAWGCTSVVCDLQEDWHNQPNTVIDSMDWRTNNNGTSSNNTGPSGDHTTGNGQYLYLETSGNGGSGCSYQHAHLLAPCIDLSNTNEPQVSFWYHAYGSSVRSLHVDAFINGNWQENITEPIIGDQGDQWLQRVVPLDSFIDECLVLRFRGKSGDGYQSDIALDDIQINTLPKGGFHQSMTYVCQGQIVHLNDQSHHADSVHWYIQPGSFSFVANTNSTSWSPKVQIGDTGVFTVQQVVFNSFGTDTTVSHIDAGPHDIRLTSSSNFKSCSGDSVTFEAQSNASFYDFYVNGSLQQSSSSNTFTQAFTQNANISVRGRVNAGCFTKITSKQQMVSHLSDTVLQVDDVTCFEKEDGYVLVEGVEGIGDLQYTWQDGATGSQRDTLAAGTYQYTITDEPGCHASGSAVVGMPSALSANTTQQPVDCHSGQDGSAMVQPQGGTEPYTMEWNTGAETMVLNGVAAGSYQYTITDSNSCTFTDSVMVNQPNPLNASYQVSNVTCAGDTNGSIHVNTMGGNGTYQYEWANGSQDTLLESLAAGAYPLTITDGKGCTFADTVEVEEPQPLEVATIQHSKYICPEGSGRIEVSATGGTGTHELSWSTGDSVAMLSNLAAGNFDLTITDDHNCTFDTSFAIAEAAPIEVETVNLNAPSCHGDADGSIAIQASGGMEGIAFAWSTGATDTLVTGLSKGTYQVSLTDSLGCQVDTAVQLDEPQALDLAIVDFTDTICPHSGEGKIAVAAQGGTPVYQYSWQDGTTDSLREQLEAGTYQLTLTDANNCLLKDSFEIRAHPMVPLLVAPATDTASCDPVEFTASGNFTQFTWQDGSQGASFEAGESGGIYVSGIDSNGCQVTSDTMQFELYPTPQGYEIFGPDTVAVNSTTNFFATADPSATFDWTVNGGTLVSGQGSDTMEASWQQLGTYEIEMAKTNVHGCEGAPVTKSVVVTEPSGIADHSLHQQVEVFPNPNSGHFQVNGVPKNARLEVFNATGERVYINNSPNTSNTIDLGPSSKGLYLVTVKVGVQKVAFQVVVQ